MASVFPKIYIISHEQQPIGIRITLQNPNTGNLYTGSTQQGGDYIKYKTVLLCIKKSFAKKRVNSAFIAVFHLERNV